MRRPGRAARLALAAGLGLAAAAPAPAYQRDEHYYSVRVTLAALRPRLRGDEVVALCGQLADEAPELNAIEVYKRLMRHPLDYASWTLRGAGPDATVGRMVTIQQLLHGLTGGSSAAMRAVAVDAVRGARAGVEAARRDPTARADALCALGFALHLYGDSFAHQRLKNPSRMYRTGIGHLFDASTPDFPLSSPARLDLWRQYVSSARTLLPAASAEALEPLLTAASEPLGSARPGNGFNREALLKLEAGELARRRVAAAPLALNTKGLSCQALVDAYAAEHALAPAPDCERSWALFRRMAERAYASYDAGPAAAAAPSRGARRRAFYDGPIFPNGDR